MFGPSFFTGALIKRVGVLNVLLAGAAFNFICVGIAMNGHSVMHFWWALTLLGVGWNFLYIGGTTLLTEAHDPAEKAKIQGVNDFLIYVVMIISSLTGGVIVTGGGWASAGCPAFAPSRPSPRHLWPASGDCPASYCPESEVLQSPAGHGALPRDTRVRPFAAPNGAPNLWAIASAIPEDTSRGEGPLAPPGALSAHS